MTSCCWYYPPALSSIFLTSPCSGCLLFWALTCFGRCQVGKSMVGPDGHSSGLTFLLVVTNGHRKSCISTFTLGHSHFQKVHGFSCSPGKIKALPCSLSLQVLLSTWICAEAMTFFREVPQTTARWQSHSVPPTGLVLNH